jgi:hypothetical protein
MASIYGLVTETKKNYSGFYEKSLQYKLKKKTIYGGFYGKTAAKTILQRFLR